MPSSSVASSPPGSPTLAIFDEPEDFRPKTPPPKTTSYTLRDGRELTFRLVGQNPLWGHILWHAGRVLGDYIQDHMEEFAGKSVLELGAGAGTPGVVAGIVGAKPVVITDFPDPDLISNIQHNVDNLIPEGRGFAEGYAWGKDAEQLVRHLPEGSGGKFDVMLLADLMFNHSEHKSMVKSLKNLLKPGTGRGYVFFTPHRTWLFGEDLNFFERVKKAGGEVERFGEFKMDSEMFIEDKGDPELRRTVFMFKVWWPEGWEDTHETYDEEERTTWLMRYSGADVTEEERKVWLTRYGGAGMGRTEVSK